MCELCTFKASGCSQSHNVGYSIIIWHYLEGFVAYGCVQSGVPVWIYIYMTLFFYLLVKESCAPRFCWTWVRLPLIRSKYCGEDIDNNMGVHGCVLPVFPFSPSRGIGTWKSTPVRAFNEFAETLVTYLSIHLEMMSRRWRDLHEMCTVLSLPTNWILYFFAREKEWSLEFNSSGKSIWTLLICINYKETRSKKNSTCQ